MVGPVPMHHTDLSFWYMLEAEDWHCRLKLDREVEAAYEERLSRLCYNERVAQHHQMAWGNVKKARAMELQYCKEYDERFGARQYQQQRAFAF